VITNEQAATLVLEATLKLRTQRDELLAALEEATAEIEDWAAYASEYFQDKHDLQGTLAKLRDVYQRNRGQV
jgi:hypothetical protein